MGREFWPAHWSGAIAIGQVAIVNHRLLQLEKKSADLYKLHSNIKIFKTLR